MAHKCCMTTHTLFVKQHMIMSLFLSLCKFYWLEIWEIDLINNSGATFMVTVMVAMVACCKKRLPDILKS